MSATLEHRPRHGRDRVDTLHEMLTRYESARAESNGGGSSGGRNESRLLGFDPQTWTREYQELERCLNALRYLGAVDSPIIEKGVSAQRAWWHISHRYLRTETVRREIHMRRTHSGERVPARLPANMEVVSRQTILHGKSSYMLVRVWDTNVDPKVVGAALRWIARSYNGTPAVYDEQS